MSIILLMYVYVYVGVRTAAAAGRGIPELDDMTRTYKESLMKIEADTVFCLVCQHVCTWKDRA